MQTSPRRGRAERPVPDSSLLVMGERPTRRASASRVFVSYS